jgi:hypothetical protein
MENQSTPSPSSKNKTKASTYLDSVYFPVVHLNGTGREQLKEDYKKAYIKLKEFTEAFSSIEFHPRDYYVIEDENAHVDARELRHKIYSMLNDISNYLRDHYYHLCD